MADSKERLLARKQDIERRLAAIEEAEAKEREERDRQKAELAGYAVLKRAREDESFARTLRLILDAELKPVRQRKLFDLPRHKPPAKGEGEAQPSSETPREAAQ